ncbi:MAG: shikimate dehydrogenase [Bacteroidales bacterium]|nr:shikimate dehydrogenase [Bacteroidales bacterium]MDD4216368.1 shikimate dehydrogenase [Bacteroidales bacterium]MDY0140472.1 shikimate dehydrogenase [Bacteroidales bacterium]
MRKFGLIGYPLEHAYSHKYFAEKFKKDGITDAKYELFSISEIAKIKNIIASHPKLVGLNVTTPYKELVIPFLDDMDKTILKLGTVNTVKIFRNGEGYRLKGFNTDVAGLEKTFDQLKITPETKALILGSGGSGKTLSYVLDNRGIASKNVSRNPSNLQQISYKKLNKSIFEEYKLIINASPVGMFPNIKQAPDISYNFITEEHICIDLVYNPAETMFLNLCRQNGAKTVNGLTMLYEQADKAWEIWNSDEC